MSRGSLTRPDSACMLHAVPTEGKDWTPADEGYRTCADCLDRLREALRDIVVRYLRLDPRPGASGDGGRGAPGYGSRPPANDHVITMRDRRSKTCETSRDGWMYIADPSGEYVEKRDVWHEPVRLPSGIYGHDARTTGRADTIVRRHCEDERPPKSVRAVLGSWCDLVAEGRAMTRPISDVAGLARWLDSQLDYVTRRDWVIDLAQDLRGLVRQLRPVTGDPGRRKIGDCPNTLDEGDATRDCAAPLYAPLRGDTIACSECGRRWPRPEWEELGRLLPQTA